MNNIKDLRNLLSDNLKKIETGEMTQQTALEICRTSQVIVNTLKIEIDYHRYIKTKEKISFLEYEKG
jgi:hypothetical protein